MKPSHVTGLRYCDPIAMAPLTRSRADETAHARPHAPLQQGVGERDRVDHEEHAT
jgi:hypothetical protein